MNVRPTQNATYRLVRSGLNANFGLMARAQEQLATGRSLLRPSDDPIGASRSLSLRSQVAATERWQRAADIGRPVLQAASAALEQGTDLMAHARELVLQAMNGTLSETDRGLVAGELELVRDQLLDVANRQLNGRSLFSGTATDGPAFVEAQVGGQLRATYAGDAGAQAVQVASEVAVRLGLPGSEVFADGAYTGTSYAGLTGVAAGTTPDAGTGSETLELRNDATTGPLGAGLAFAAAGGDTLLGTRALVVDAADGTVRLGAGTPVSIPDPAAPEAADVVVRDAGGAELHLDFSGWTGADFTGTVTGSGSISIDGATWVPIDFSETDLELVHPDTGVRVHVDLTGARRAGRELVTFSGTENVFDTLQGLVDDLRNGDGLDPADVVARLEQRLSELDRNQENIIRATSVLGMRTARIDDASERLADHRVQLDSLLSDVEDADVASVVLDLTKAQQALELSQMSGSRLIQTSLLNFLR